MITINGEKLDNIAGMTVAAYLLENGYDRNRVAVEVDGEIVPKMQYESTVLQDDNIVEVVSFVGGG